MRLLGVLALLPLGALAADPQEVPVWAQQGKFRFTRLDGGPIEVQKTTRSAWGMHFNENEKEVLANLYTKYSDRTLDLLERARINWVWLTWSVGFSWQDEAEQREQCRRFVARLHQRGIRAAAYTCAVSLFWESMFRDEPRSVRWITFDSKGVPYRYSGGRDPLRFIADVSNPEWVELQKRRVGAAIDAGFDALFFDNTAPANWAGDAALDAFVGKIRQFIHEEKRSNLLLFTNYGLTPTRAALNRNMDFVFAEGWREPGAWGEEWNVSNIRRTKYLRGMIPSWKPLTTEYSMFHSGNRATTFMGPRSQKLATAEAAAFGSDYSWDMEGPFDAALMAATPAAMEAWEAIGQYARFLREHEELYWNARAVSPIAVLMPAAGVSFAWDKEESGFYDLLARNSILFDIRPLQAGTADQLRAYQGLVLPPGQEKLREQYKAYAPRAGASESEILSGVRALAPGAIFLQIEGAPHVLGTVTRLGDGKRLAVHLLNYAPAPVSGVKVRVHLDRELRPRLVTPDAGTRGLHRQTQAGKPVPLEFTLDSLDVYAVVVLEG